MRFDGPKSRRQVRVLLVDGDAYAAKNLETSLNESGMMVNSVCTLADAKAFLRQDPDPVDVVVFELRLPDGNGGDLLPEIEVCPRQPVAIIVSAFLSDLCVDSLEYRPIVLAKPVNTAMLLGIVRTVVGGYARPIIKRFVTCYCLSRRETEAAVLVAQGLRPKEIAKAMDCTEPTVYGHLSRTCAKVGCSDYHELAAELFTFACQARGHTPPDHRALAGREAPTNTKTAG